MATPLPSIECSAQPLSISFHPSKDIVAAGLVDGTVEIHDLIAPPLPNLSDDDDENSNSSDNDHDMSNGEKEDVADTILASITVAKEVSPSKMKTQMLAKLDHAPSSSNSAAVEAIGKATQGPSCRCVLFSRSSSPNEQSDDKTTDDAGQYIYTACNNGSVKCLDTEIACNSLNHIMHDNPTDDKNPKSNPILWSIDNAHNVGINTIYQLPHNSPCGPGVLVTGDDVGTVRLWDTRLLSAAADANTQNNNNSNGTKAPDKSSNPFDNLMKLPTGCIQHWKVNHDYITDFTTNNDGTTLFATSADGTLSVFDIRYVTRKNTSRCITLPDVDLHKPIPPQQSKNNGKSSTWETMGYSQSDNQEDELLSITLLKNSTKVLVGSQQGILSLFSYNIWNDISDRFPGHPQSIDALLKIDEDTVLTGSSDGLVRAVQLLPNMLLGVLGSHDNFPIEDLGWSANRKMVGSISHDEYIRLWDASLLNDDDDDDDSDDNDGDDSELKDSKVGNQEMDEAISSKKKKKQGGLGKGGETSTKLNDSEDDWEDMDEDNEDVDMDSDSDSDSDDSSDNGGGGREKSKKQREQIFKSGNDEFFSDL